MNLSSFSFTCKGGREENQDAAAVGEGISCAMYAVADGLGGHQHGRDASTCVVKALLEVWNEKKPEDPVVWLKEQFAQVNQKVLELQQTRNSTMKTTLVALLVDGNTAAWAHCGDSRLYHFSEGRLANVTADHSLAYKKYEAGKIRRSQIAKDEDQSSLFRVVGSVNKCNPEINQCELLPGDAFLLCSDGLWEYVNDDEILVDLFKSDNPRDWAHLVMQRAIARIQPGNDNLTILTVMVE